MRNVTVPAALLISASAVSQPVEILLEPPQTLPTCASFLVGCTLPPQRLVGGYGVRLWPAVANTTSQLRASAAATVRVQNGDCKTVEQRLHFAVTTSHSWSVTVAAGVSVEAEASLLSLVQVQGHVDTRGSLTKTGTSTFEIFSETKVTLGPGEGTRKSFFKDDYVSIATQVGAHLSVIVSGCGAGEICESGPFTNTATGDGDDNYDVLIQNADLNPKPYCGPGTEEDGI